MEFLIKKETMPFSEPEVFSINSSEVNSLALIATTLEAESEVTEAFGYASALEKYMSNAKNSELKERYRELVSDQFGRMLLCQTIDLQLLEQSFRSTGITEKGLEVYNRKQAEYQKLIDFNYFSYGSKPQNKVL